MNPNKMVWRLKFTAMNGRPVDGGTGKYPPLGVWTPKRKVWLCHYGWHVSDAAHGWRYGNDSRRCFIVQVDGNSDGSMMIDDKECWQRMRLLYELTVDDMVRLLNKMVKTRVLKSGFVTDKAFKLVNSNYHARSIIDDVSDGRFVTSAYRGLYLDERAARESNHPLDALMDEVKEYPESRVMFEAWVERKLRRIQYPQ